MKKFLRFTFIAVLAMIANVSFAETTVTFTAGTDVSAGATLTKEGVTFTMEKGTSTSGVGPLNVAQYRIYKGNDFTVSSTIGTITKIVFTCTAKGTAKYGPGSFASLEGYTFEDEIGTWSGNAKSVKFTAESNQVRATKIEVTIDGQGGGDTPTPPVVTYTDVASVKDLLTNYTDDATNLNLKLTNAKVLYVNNYNGTVNTYVREGESAIELRTLGFDMPVNSLINGTAKVDLAYSYGVPYLKANAGTDDEDLSIKENAEDAAPIEATVADILAKKYLNDLVIVKDFTFSKEEYQTDKYNYYANDGENKIMLYDKFSKVGGVADLTEGEKYTVVGLFGAIFKGTPEILPTKSIAETTGINDITTDATTANASVYNLSGQKVSESYKGIIIKAGKKFIQK